MFFLHLIRKLLSGRKRVPKIQDFTSNQELKTVRQDWAGTPVDQNGLFINEEFPTVIDYRAIFRFLIQRNPQRGEPEKVVDRLKNEGGIENKLSVLKLGKVFSF